MLGQQSRLGTAWPPGISVTLPPLHSEREHLPAEHPRSPSLRRGTELLRDSMTRINYLLSWPGWLRSGPPPGSHITCLNITQAVPCHKIDFPRSPAAPKLRRSCAHPLPLIYSEPGTTRRNQILYNKRRDLVVTSIHTRSSQDTPGSTRHPALSPEAGRALPKCALTRCRRCNTAQSSSQARALDAVALAMTRSTARSTTPRSRSRCLPLNKLSSSPQKPSMFRSLRQMVPQRYHHRLCERCGRGGLSQSWNHIDILAYCVFIHDRPLRADELTSGCIDDSQLFHSWMICGWIDTTSLR
jgi:hypothetical protein